MSAWYERPVHFFQHLLREADAGELDASALTAEVQEVGANGYIAMGGGFSAWYPTRLPSQTVNPHMRGDFLGEVLDAARSAGIRVLVRMDISKARPDAAHAPVEWLVRAEDGSLPTLWGMNQMCATGDFWQEQNFAIVDEIMTRYAPVDGFFYNYYYVPLCHCERCRGIVKAETGEDVPARGVRSPAYEGWRQDFLAQYTERLRAAIKTHRQDAALVPYHHVRDGWDMVAMARHSDIVSSQISNPIVPNPVDPQPMWNHWAAEEALRGRALRPGTRPLLIQTTSALFASRQTVLPEGRMLHNMVMAAAHGASPTASANGRLAGAGGRTAATLHAFGAFLKRNAGWYDGLRSVARVAIVWSPESLAWGPDAGRGGGARDCDGHVAEFRGLYEALSAARHPCDVVVAGALDVASLSRYDLVILPAVSHLSDRDAAALDAFVANGGRLLATADTGRADEDDVARVAPALASLPALPGAASSCTGCYFELRGAGLRNLFEGLPFIGATGDFWTPELEEEGDLRLIGPFINNAPEFTSVSGPGKAPGAFFIDHGKGQAIWLTFRPGALYHRHGLPDVGRLVGYLAETAVGPAPIQTDASAAVDFTLYANEAGLVLHAINSAAVAGKPLARSTRLAGFTVTVRCDADKAILLNDGVSLPVKREDDYAVFTLRELDSFAAVALPNDVSEGGGAGEQQS